ncbi:MAG TPA: OsmC family protein [Steroidobacteraceae bacterium]|nr:OsmC family protein [Steroidobacteraceae bacterium]
MSSTHGQLLSHPTIEVDWLGASEFEAHRAGGPKIHIDGDSKAAPSPFDTLLAAIATCAATDVVSILAKQRTPVEALRVAVESQRADATPRRLASVVLHFSIVAPGTTRAKAGRAIELSVTRYCSVRSSLLGEIPVTWTVALED